MNILVTGFIFSLLSSLIAGWLLAKWHSYWKMRRKGHGFSREKIGKIELFQAWRSTDSTNPIGLGQDMIQVIFGQDESKTGTADSSPDSSHS